MRKIAPVAVAVATTLMSLPGQGPVGSAAAPSATPSGDPTRWSVRGVRLHVLWQNDSWLTDSDRFFTNGAELGGTFAAAPDTLSWLPFCGEPTLATHQLAIGQQMYTPEDFEAAVPDPRDRPYAGWLYAAYRHERLTLERDRRDHLDLWELELGVVGPSSLADDTQTQIHQMVGAPRPQGWSNQLHDEPGLVIGYGRRFRPWFSSDLFGPLQADLISELGARLGNVDTSARLGSTLRLGFNLPRHLGSAARPEGSAPHRLYLQAGIEGRLVLRNIFLDGNTWRSSASVDRNYFVSDFVVGLTWELPNNTRLLLTQTFRTPEFDSPSQQGDPTYFTSLQFQVFF